MPSDPHIFRIVDRDEHSITFENDLGARAQIDQSSLAAHGVNQPIAEVSEDLALSFINGEIPQPDHLIP